MWIIPKGDRMVDRIPRVDIPLARLPKEDLDVYAGGFERTGLRGALNRYSNLDQDSDHLAALRGQPLQVPTLFIGGDKHGPTVRGASAMARFPEMLPLLKGSHILLNCGHWI
jgi:pimeloyl-ACP methyl ester carboxylesterase